MKPHVYQRPSGAFSDFDRPKWWFKARREVEQRAYDQDVKPTAVEEMFFGHISTRTEIAETVKRVNLLLKEHYTLDLNHLYRQHPFFNLVKKESF